MADKLLHPLEFNPVTKEPYLRLIPPHENIILTPSRLSDVPAVPPILNDPRVYMTLIRPPYPYTEDDAKSWIQQAKDYSDKIMNELQDGEPRPDKIVSGCPVNILREVNADGTDVYLGEIDIHRCYWFEMKDKEMKERLVQENEARILGDPEIVWELGDYLKPSHHSKGIMSTAIKTFMTKWAIPRMGVRKVQINTRKGNRASVRVFEKNGFVLKDTVDDCVEISERKGGGRMGLHVLSWDM